MKKLFFFIFMIITLITGVSDNSFCQVCSVTSVGFTPINVLGAGTFRGFQGGLYPGGSNVRPVIMYSKKLPLIQPNQGE
jgi:hypothetical protein